MLTFNEWLIQLVEENSEKKSIFVLVGPPAVGKSTWIKNTFAEKNPYIISRDDIVNKIADSMGITYDEMFVRPNEPLGFENEKYGTVVNSPAFMKWQPLSYSKILEANTIVNNLLKERFNNAVQSGKDIVVDMTNMTANARKQALKAVEGKEDMYDKIAVVFSFEGAEDIIKKVSKRRSEEESKTIPEDVLDKMMSSFQKISPDENFDKVISVDNREALKRLVQIG